MNLLNWGYTENDPGLSLREVVDNIQKVSALVELVVGGMKQSNSEYDEDSADTLLNEAAHLLPALTARALELLDAQAAPVAPTPIRAPRARTARRRAA
jgi:hypothetical protein